MPSIGDTLREARMRQRLDIADVETKTKIRAKYLRALENEEFGMLPGPTFVKTFLRTYAEALGLDPHLLVEEYRAAHEDREELEHLQPLGPPGVGRERRRPGPPIGAGVILAAGVVVIVAALLVIGLLGEDDNGDREKAAEQTTTQPKRQRPSKREPKPPPRRVVLRIAPITPTYLCLDSGEGTDIRFNGILEAPQTFRGKRLRVNLGKTDVEVRLNGKRFDLVRGPDPVGFDFRPRSTRELPSGERPCA